MTNIINSDFYRLKKGKSLLIILIVTIGLVALIWGTTSMTSSIIASIPQGDMSASDMASLLSDLEESQNALSAMTSSSQNFINEIMGQNFIFFLFLPIILAIFCADFDFGTYKNTLSFESNRTKVFFGRLLLATLLCVGIKLVSIISAVIMSALFITGDGLTISYLSHLFLTFLLQMPIYFSIISLTFCLITFFKKNGATIATYLVGLIVLSVALQTLSSLKESINWVTLFDPMQVSTLLATPNALGTKAITITMIIYCALSVLFTLIGAVHFKKQDLN